MSLSSDLISQFVKVTNDKTSSKSETTAYGTVAIRNNRVYVKIDGSDGSLTPITTTANVKEGERVTVMIKNHTSTITGNITSPSVSTVDISDVTTKADNALSTATKANNNVQSAIDAAASAQTKAEEALTAANSAQTSATEAKTLADTASTEAAEAQEKATEAQSKADLVETNLSNVNKEIDSVKEDAIQLRLDLEDEIGSVRNEMYTSYATKDDLSSTETSLRSEITQSASEIQQTVEQTYAKQTEVDDAITTVKENLQTQITQNADSITSLAKSIEEIQVDVTDQNGKISEAQTAADNAQATADAAKLDATQAKTAADNAQAAADEANAAAATAQTVADAAKADLATAQAKLSAVESDVNSTKEDIEAAQAAVQTAQTAADNAQAAADNAASSASKAQTAADNAQAKADEAKTAADNAQAAADEAKEDLEALEKRVAIAETAIEQNSEAITLRATKTELAAVASSVETAQNTADGVKTDLASNYYTKSQTGSLITVESDSIKSSVSATYATKTSLENTQAEIDNLTIGGRNYFTLSGVVDLGCTGLASGEQSLISTGSCIGFYVPVTAGELWSLSRESASNNRFDYCFTVDEPASGVLIYSWNQAYREKLEIEGIVIPEGYNYLFLYLSNQADNMPNIKLEKGNKVTDWTPSPDDMATSDDLATVQSSAELTEERITTAETLIQQLSDSIYMLVTDGNGESLMTQTESGWTFSTSRIQEAVDATSENLDNLTNEVGDINSTVNILQQAVDDLGILSDYVKITTYEDEPCIELGETDSDFKLLITNTRIMFMEGSDVPAYINNQSLFIKKAVIEEELQQGEFVWKSRSNGNLGLIWKGATE